MASGAVQTWLLGKIGEDEYYTTEPCLPNKHGEYKRKKIPQYIEDILIPKLGSKGIRYRTCKCIGLERYRLRGWNYTRRAYGVEADIEKLQKYMKRYSTTIEDIKIHKARKDYYVDFTMYGPAAVMFENAGLIQK